MKIRIVLLVFLMLLGAACNGSDDVAASTTIVTVGSTLAQESGSGTVTESETETDTSPTTVASNTGSVPLAADPVAFEVAVQETNSDGLDELVVVVPAEEYSFDEMENLMRDIVDAYPTAITVRVVSDQAAVDAAVRYGTTDTKGVDDAALLEEHFLVELVDGIRLIFHGPYEPLGEASLGS